MLQKTKQNLNKNKNEQNLHFKNEEDMITIYTIACMKPYLKKNVESLKKNQYIFSFTSRPNI